MHLTNFGLKYGSTDKKQKSIKGNARNSYSVSTLYQIYPKAE